jgi:sec-independent protein translocase protein TatB
MFDFAWSELAIIGVIALVVVGPKDLPKLMRSAGKAAAQARRMADEFRGQMNEAMRDTELDDLRKSVDEIRSLDPRSMIREEVAKLAEPVRTLAEDVRHELTDAQAQAAAGMGQPGMGQPVDAGAVDLTIPDASPTLARVEPAPAAPIDLALPEMPEFTGPPEIVSAEIKPAEPEPVPAIDLGGPLDLAPAPAPMPASEPKPVATAAIPPAELKS